MFMALSPRDPADPPQHGAHTAPLNRILVHREHERGREEVESFIRAVYAERFGAELQRFAPVLVSLRDESGQLVAAAGYRGADSGTLFLERYLAAPVEALLATHAEAAPQRGCVVEVGHLAAGRAGEGRRLIRLLAPHLAGLGFQWVVSTLTEELRHLFVRIGVPPLALGMADPALLGDDAHRWGSYYEHHPVVLAGNLQQALRQLARRAPAAELPA